MRLFRRWPWPKRRVPFRYVPKMETLEDRMVPAAPLGEFQSSLGLLNLQSDSGHAAVSASITTNGFVQVSVGNQIASSDPSSANYDAALAGATAQTLKEIQLSGGSDLDHLILGNLSVTGGLSIDCDGLLDVEGQVSAGGPVQLSGQSVKLVGQVRSDGVIGGSITVTAGNVLQSGLLEADGSQGSGGSINVDFTEHYLATTSARTAASSSGSGSGGLIVIDGFGTGTLFSSGTYQADAVQGSQGGQIDLFGQQVHLVGANVDASGLNGGGWVRVGGDSPADIAAHGGSTAGVSDATTTTVDATTTLSANALGSGNGGQIAVWSQQTTTFGGTLSAEGNSGLLEVSSAGQLIYGGHATATSKSGPNGRLLLDPQNLIVSNSVSFPQFNLVNPAPSVFDNFGASVVTLSNGNVVVTDPDSSLAASFAGAVFLYDGQTGALLGTLTGATANDQVGSGGVTALSNGNFVVGSPNWQNGGVAVGAATWVSGSGGVLTAVSVDNSLVGSTAGDNVGTSVTALVGGNYVVSSPYWQDGGNVVGAVTWGDGETGTVGTIDASNSLVGSTNGDEVGIDGVTALTNGNYVVSSSFWQNPNGSGGAVTWGNGAGGTVGAVSAENSLTGDVNSGDVGGIVTALSDGNYVVSSAGWQDDGNPIGAVTWCDGSTGTIGLVSASNSLVGSTTFDEVGSGGVKALSDGNYVVSSPYWQDGDNTVGAVTFGAAGGGTVGTISASNSLIGSTNGDNVGSGGVTLLSDGSYVVSSPDWQNGDNDVGAVTWAAADGSTVGAVTTGNSLVGSTNNDEVGSGGVTALSDGSYVVSSPYWQSGGNDVGAVTWAAAGGGTVGAVTTGNSLVGSTAGDDVGSGGVSALNDGAYVVSSPDWQDATGIVGAVTFSPAGGTTGPVSASNSLVGATDGDQVGSGGITVLSNGDYLISSPSYQAAGGVVGAVTWASGTTGLTIEGNSTIDAMNSVFSASSGVFIQQVVGLSGGDAFVASFGGNGGTVTMVQLQATSEDFNTAPALNMSVSSSFLGITLDTGTAVILQASNDLTVNSAIVENNPTGNGGDLTLVAGRQVIINANITTDNGDLTIIANAPASYGVVDSERESGLAVVTMSAGTLINAGTGNVTVEVLDGAGNTNYASNDITMGAVTAHNLTIINDGPGDASLGGDIPGGNCNMASVTLTGNLTVQSTLNITQFGALFSTDPNIINVAGTTSLTANGNGDILLNNSANIFGGLVTYNDPDQDVTIDASGDLKLASTTTAATLTAAAGGTLSESGALSVSGASSLTGATVTLTNASNSFQGEVTLSSTGAISLTDSADLSLGDLSLAGSASLIAPTITFTGSLDVGAQTLTLTPTSDGAAELDGATTLEGGTISDSTGLEVGSGASLSGSGILEVGTGAAGVLVDATGTLTPGGLTIDGDLTLSATSIFAEQIQGTSAFGQLTVNGDIDLGGATLDVTFLSPYTPTAFDQFDFLENGGSDAITGTFAQGTTFLSGSTALTLSYLGGAGHDADVTIQGAPASVTTLPAFSSPTFSVSWSGTEYAAGATTYNVYVSDDAGSYTLWQTATTQTSADYDGVAGHTYSFFAVYTDDDALYTPSSQTSTTAKIVPTINWNTPTDIVYGTPLSGTQLGATATTVIGDDTVTVAGSFVYTPVSGTVLDAGSDQELSVTFTPNDTTDYASVTTQVYINVTTAMPTFSGLSSPTITYGALTTAISGHINANANGQSIPTSEYVQVTVNGVEQNAPIDASGNFTTTFDTHALGVAGSAYTVSFNYAGDTDFHSATDSSSLTVNPASQSISFNVTSPVVYSDPINLSATGGSSGNSVTFSVVSGPGTITGNVLDFTGTGSVVVEADQAGTANFTAAPPVQRSIVVGTTYSDPVSENENGTQTVVTVTSVLGAHYSDPDGTSVPGIAIFQQDGTGTWQYSTNGTTWITITGESQTQSLLLPGADKLRFVPAANTSGVADLYFVAWDGSQGTAGSLTSIASNGGTTPFSVDAGALTMTVNAVPRWVGSGAALTSVLPGTYSTTNPSTPAGNTITSVFGAFFQDNNSVPVGVAINSVSSTTNGTWQYMLSGTSTWVTFPTVSTTSALLLEGSDMIRFVPKTNFVGTVSLKALAWDGSVGTDGTHPNPATLASSAFSTATITATASANRAPTLSKTAITQGNVAQYATGAAVTVSTLLTNSGEADPDGSGAAKGIAITATAPNQGTFQYMLSGGTWQNFPSISTSSALLLPSTASVRLVAGNPLGAATFTFAGWDQTLGVAGQTYNISSSGTGGATAFSTASTTVTFTVTTSTNHSPALSHSTFSEPAVTVNTTGAAVTVSTLMTQAGYTDQDTTTLKGIAITGLGGSGGTLQYMLSANNWITVPSVSSSSALLLPSTASIRLVGGSQTNTVTFTLVGWDETQGTAGQLFNIANSGGASAFSSTSATASISIRQAPSWNAISGAGLTANLPGTYSTSNNSLPAGNTVAAVFGAYFADIQSGLQVGIAVAGVSGTGTWQYSINGGTSWTTFSAPSKTAALLLSSTDMIRFVPSTTAATIGTLTAYAWDGSTGTHGTTANLTTLGTGGASAFSATTLAATSPFNRAPTLSKSSFTLTTTPENVASATVTATTLLTYAGYSDPDGTKLPSGIAITGVNASSVGTWQWLNGTLWTALPSVSTSSPFLLAGATQLRFMPANNLATSTTGTASLTFLGWDETAGVSGNSYSLGTPGGATAFSATSATASMTISFVRQAPTWLTGGTAKFTPVVGFNSTSNPTPSPAGDQVSNVFGSAFYDAAGASVGIAVVGATDTADGTWEYSTNGGSTWTTFGAAGTTFGAVSNSNALLLSANDMIRFVPKASFTGTATLTVLAWDGSQGTAAATGATHGFSITTTGGTTAFSTAKLTATILINSAPVLEA